LTQDVCSDPLESAELGVDLAELDAPAADFDLVVAASDEHQPVGGLADDVPGGVRPLPAERGHRREAFGVHDRIQIAGHARSRDHQLAGIAGFDRLAVFVDDGGLPAV